MIEWIILLHIADVLSNNKFEGTIRPHAIIKTPNGGFGLTSDQNVKPHRFSSIQEAIETMNTFKIDWNHPSIRSVIYAKVIYNNESVNMSSLSSN